MKNKWTTIGLLIFLTMACQHSQNFTSKEGYIPVTGGKIWYRIDGSGNQTPLVLLHGGPAGTSYYLNPLSALGKDRPVIFFDQLGCGRSDRIQDENLMSINSYLLQFEELCQALNLKKFHLYGQSWGAVLATEFYFKHPDRVQSLILSSPLLSTPMWIVDAKSLIATLPDSVQQAILTNETAKTFDSPAYQQAMMVYYQHFVARNLPWSYDLDSAFAGTGMNVYQKMWGPSEFTATGTLKDYDITSRLPQIKVPALFICGEYDEARPATVQHFQSLVPDAKFHMVTGAGHITVQDDPNADITTISDFLNHIK